MMPCLPLAAEFPYAGRIERMALVYSWKEKTGAADRVCIG
jgi:hypothetical protein